MQPLLEITLFSLAISLVLVLVTKFTTNPAAIRGIKQEMEDYKKKAKEAQNQKNQEEAKRYSDLMLKKSQEQFKHSTKPMIVSMLIVMVAFGWIGTSFSSLSTALVDKNSTLEGNLVYKSESSPVSVDSHLEKASISGKNYKIGDIFEFAGSNWKVQKISKASLDLEMLPAVSPVDLPFVGKYLTWFWLYIFITLPTTLIFRKVLGVE